MKLIKKYQLPLILFFGLVLRLVNLSQSFWLDEAAQVIESARPLAQQLDIPGDFQPPLFHVLLHFWMYIGTSEMWIRLLPVFLSVGAIYGSYLFGKKIKSHSFGLLLAFLLAIAPYHIYYSQEIRPYPLSLLLGLFATYFLFSKRFVAYFISGTLFLYSIYLAPFLIIAHGVWIIMHQRKSLKIFLISVVGIVLVFLPWAPFLLEQLRIGTRLTSTLAGWGTTVSPELFKSLPLVFVKFALGRITIDHTIVYASVIIAIFLGFLFLLFRSWQKEQKNTYSLVTIFAVPIIIAFVISFFVPVLAPQRVLFTLPFFYGLVALGIYSSPRKLQQFAIAAISITSIASIYMYYTNPRFQREQWQQAVSFVEKQAVAESLAVFVFPDTFAPWQWYATGSIDGLGIAPEFVLTQSNLERFAPVITSRNKIFLFQYLTDLTDPDNRAMQFLEQEGFVQSEVKDFPGVGLIYIYEKLFAQN